MNLEQLILTEIDKRNGCKAIELASEPALVMANDYATRNLPEVFERMVAEGQMIEIEYIQANIPTRIKSFYLPKTTKVQLLCTLSDGTTKVFPDDVVEDEVIEITVKFPK